MVRTGYFPLLLDHFANIILYFLLLSKISGNGAANCRAHARRCGDGPRPKHWLGPHEWLLQTDILDDGRVRAAPPEQFCALLRPGGLAQPRY